MLKYNIEQLNIPVQGKERLTSIKSTIHTAAAGEFAAGKESFDSGGDLLLRTVAR